MRSQNESILKDLKKGKTITPIDALQWHGCLRLAARIWDLRDEGHKIETLKVQKNKKTFAGYRLKRKS